MASSANIPIQHSAAFPASRIARVVWWIAAREIAEQITSLRFAVITGLVLLLTPLAVYVGTRDYKNRLADYDRLQAEKQKLVSGPAGKEVRGDRSIQLRAIRLPQAESVLVRGLDNALPQYWDFSEIGTIVGPPASTPRRVADLLGQLDFEFLVRVTLGLLAILLAFDAVAGEKELGTLRAVLSQPVSRATLLVGKLAGGAATLLTPLAVALFVALLSAQLFGVDLIAAGASPKLVLLWVDAGAYLIAFYALGLLVSSLAASQKTALVVLLVLWVITVLAIPPTATLVAQAISPVPMPHVLETQKRALDQDIRVQTERAMGDVYREISHLPVGWADSSKYQQNKKEIDSRIVPIEVDYLNKRRQLFNEIDRDAERRESRQNSLARALMFISPAAVFAESAADLAGTGDAQRASWVQAVRQYKGGLDSALFENPPVVTLINGRTTLAVEIHKPPALADLPVFSPPRRDAAATFAQALPALGMLVLFSGIFIAGSLIAFSRYDVR